MSLKCSYCGRFISEPYDSGTHFGDSTMMDPPDELLFCRTCAKSEMEHLARNPGLMSIWWIRPNLIQGAKAIIRHQRKTAGEVSA